MPIRTKIEPGSFAQKMRCVYFLEDTNTGLIKIGIASDVRIRIRTLENDNKTTLRFLGYIGGNKHDETALHLQFRDYCVMGEWFSPEPALLEYISEKATKTMPPEMKPTYRATQHQFYINAGDERFTPILEILNIPNNEATSISICVTHLTPNN